MEGLQGVAAAFIIMLVGFIFYGIAALLVITVKEAFWIETLVAIILFACFIYWCPWDRIFH
jgi:hypothetical protein